MVARGWLVTGTGPGVGKTVVAAALGALHSGQGREVVYVKPVQAGAADGDDDAADVAALTGIPTVAGPAVGPAMAPGRAARLAGAALTAAELEGVVAEAVARHPGADLVVEGAGGLLDELGSDGTTCADLARALGLPLVIVVRPGAGMHNAAALTVEVAAGRGLAVAGVVVCDAPDDRLHAGGGATATASDLAELDRATGCLAGALPVLDLSRPSALADAAQHLGPALGGRWALPPSTGTADV